MSELLCPAGNPEALDAAIGEGADAVYLGLKSFNARMRSSNFAWNQFEAAVEAVHKRGKKIYVTVNTVIEENETEKLYRFLQYLQDVGADALIVQDFGVIRMVQEFFPRLTLHASTQMNIASPAAVNLLSKEGIKRVVLARELSFKEICAIKHNCVSQLEVFVHGALCVSESGLCLFSSYLGGKSANRGMCTQACRRYYEAEYAGNIKKHGYYFSPHDLQLIDRIPDLVTAGVDSFKIEGRMKSAEYVGCVTAAYRYVLDNWQKDKKGALETGKRMLASDFARSKTRYFFDGVKGSDFLNPDQAGGTGIYMGKIEAVKQNYALLKGGFYTPDIGDSIRLHKKDDSGRVSHKIRDIKTQTEPVTNAKSSTQNTQECWIDIPDGFSKGDSVYLLQTKSMSKRYKHVLPADLTPFRRRVSDAKLPVLDLTPVHKTSLSHFPAGLYIQVSTLSDAYVGATENPVRIIIELNSETRRSLIEKEEKPPCSKKQFFISLDPFCPADTETVLEKDIERLSALGYTQWVVNNPAHIGLLKNKNVSLIAGPYLYTFNRWAVSWLENQNIDCFTMSYETSLKNLENIFENTLRSRVLICIFAYPALFRMRFQLPQSYDFSWFNDKEGISFRALSTPDGSFVMPEKPFSIIDRINALKQAGFSRFLLDMSKTQLRRADLKALMRCLHKADALPDTERFNWKEGFYTSETKRLKDKAHTVDTAFKKKRARFAPRSQKT
ncbi:MAG: peptidase U32 family protein [Treponema lecithinolyticum]|uniref:peptidase U32 family protein n=1 Tax=Treponema lecithinolyticum TaxID=53418 RepID=UPI00361265F5